MNTSILKKIGLNEKEIVVYLKLLENGPLSVRNLAGVANLNRGTVYDVLKNLQEKGLVSHFHKESKQKFAAESPQKIMSILKEKEKSLKESEQKIQKLIPQLKSLQEKGGSLPTSKYYEGKRGVKTILTDLLETLNQSEKREYYVYSAKEVSEDINKAYPDFTEERIKKKIKVKAISLARGGKTSGLDERRWLGTNDESATFILIYSGKCAFISRDSLGKPVGVIIENEMIYETQKIIFLGLWEKLE